jgi:hypothetical protein
VTGQDDAIRPAIIQSNFSVLITADHAGQRHGAAGVAGAAAAWNDRQAECRCTPAPAPGISSSLSG